MERGRALRAANRPLAGSARAGSMVSEACTPRQIVTDLRSFGPKAVGARAPCVVSRGGGSFGLPRCLPGLRHRWRSPRGFAPRSPRQVALAHGLPPCRACAQPCAWKIPADLPARRFVSCRPSVDVSTPGSPDLSAARSPGANRSPTPPSRFLTASTAQPDVVRGLVASRYRPWGSRPFPARRLLGTKSHLRQRGRAAPSEVSPETSRTASPRRLPPARYTEGRAGRLVAARSSSPPDPEARTRQKRASTFGRARGARRWPRFRDRAQVCGFPRGSRPAHLPTPALPRRRFSSPCA